MEEIDQVYEQYAKPVYRYLFSLCGDTTLADDLTAETFYQAIRSLGSFRGESTMLTWLCQIAKHQWYGEMRRRSKAVHVPLEDAQAIADISAQPADIAEETELKLQLYRTIRKLPEPMREVMYLRLGGVLSFAEIGQLMGKSENWARVTFYRGKQKIKGENKHE